MTVSDRWRVTLGEAPIALKPSVEGAVALLCGCVAAGWQPRADTLKVLAVWLIADVLLGCVLEQLLALKQSSGPSQAADQSADARPVGLVLPYATPGSPGYRLAARANAYLTHWRDQVWPHAGQHAMTALVCAGLAMLLATYLGRELAGAVSVALLLTACLTILASASGIMLERWFAGLHVALAWALGHLAFTPWKAPSMGLALLIGLGAYARCWRRQSRRAAADWLRWAVWWALSAILLVARQPVLAGVVAIAACGSYGASLPATESDTARPSGLDRFAWIVSQGIAALAVTYWS